MRIFSPLYDLAMRWAAHRHAPRYLAGMSFAESSFFPVPPDVMLAPMVLARPDKAWSLAMLTTVASVAGGLAGYVVGYFAIAAITPWMQDLGYWQDYLEVKNWFETWGFWAILLAGFSPIPYKLFTIAGGALGMFLPVFLAGSVLGRGGRFFLVAALVKYGGPPIEATLRRYIDLIGWTVVALLVVIYLLWFR